MCFRVLRDLACYWLLRLSKHYLQPTTGTLHTIVNFQYYGWLERNHNMYDIASAMRKLHAYLFFLRIHTFKKVAYTQGHSFLQWNKEFITRGPFVDM